MVKTEHKLNSLLSVIFHDFLSSVDLFKMKFSKNLSAGTCSVKHFRSRSGPMFCLS